MGKNIRQTITVTITETWIIAWVTDDDPPRQATTMAPDQPNTQEESDAAFQATITTAEPSDPSVCVPTATPPTPFTTSNARLDDVSTKPSASGQRKRTRRRRSEGK